MVYVGPKVDYGVKAPPASGSHVSVTDFDLIVYSPHYPFFIVFSFRGPMVYPVAQLCEFDHVAEWNVTLSYAPSGRDRIGHGALSKHGQRRKPLARPHLSNRQYSRMPLSQKSMREYRLNEGVRCSRIVSDVASAALRKLRISSGKGARGPGNPFLGRSIVLLI